MLHRTLYHFGRIGNTLLRLRGYKVARVSYIHELESVARHFHSEMEIHQANQMATETETMWLRGELARLMRGERESAGLAAQVDHLLEELRDAHQWRREAAQLRQKDREMRSALEELKRLECMAIEYSKHRAELAQFAQSRLGLFLDDELQPVAHLQRGSGAERALICAHPRAGAGLVATLLQALGMVHVRLLFKADSLIDYRWASDDVVRRTAERVEHPLPLRSSLSLLAPGQFAMGHLRREENVLAATTDCKLVFVHRDLRDATISQMRATARRFIESDSTAHPWCKEVDGPDKLLQFLDLHGEALFEEFRTYADWLNEDRAIPIAFEELRGEQGLHRQRQTVRDLIDWLELPTRSESVVELLRRTFGESPSNGALRQQLRESFWDERVESRFHELGGGDIEHTSSPPCIQFAAA